MDANSRDFFDQHASDWEDHFRKEDFETIDRVFKKIGIGPADKVLDVGAGTGILVPFLIKFGCTDFVAVDQSPKMVEHYRAKHPGRIITQGNYEEDDICESGQFTKVILFNAFPHFRRPDRLAHQVFNDLRPGGSLILFHSMTREQLNQHHSEKPGVISTHTLLPSDELRSILVKAGFTDIDIHDEHGFFAEAVKPIATES